MNIDKNAILAFMQSHGHPQTEQAQLQLPDQIDTDNADHQNLLAQFGIDPANLPGSLGGLGKLL